MTHGPRLCLSPGLHDRANPENQIQEVEAAIFRVEPRRIVTETVSGSTAIAQRRGFSRLMDKLEAGDVLIVTKLDRLGRDAIDVSTTVNTLAEMGVRVKPLVRMSTAFMCENQRPKDLEHD